MGKEIVKGMVRMGRAMEPVMGCRHQGFPPHRAQLHKRLQELRVHQVLAAQRQIMGQILMLRTADMRTT